MNLLDIAAEDLAITLGDKDNIVLREKLKFTILHWRATLVRRDVERGIIDRSLIQTLCIDLEKIDKSESCKANVGCIILRSVLEIPKPINLKARTPFIFVGTLSKESFNFSAIEDWEIDSYRKFAGNLKQYDYVDNRIICNNIINTKYLLLKYIAENPEDLPKCHSTVSNVPCEDLENYPISRDMLTTIKDGILRGEFRMLNEDDQEIKIDNKQNDRN